MLASQAVEGEGLRQPSEPQHTPTTASPSHVVPIFTVASSSHLKKTHKHRKTKSKATKISQSSGSTTLVADETVHKERGDSVERAATAATSLDAEQGSGNINRTQSTAIPNDNFPQGTGLDVNTLGSGEDNMKLTELMELCTKLSERVLALENIKTAQDLEITNLKKRVKKLEKKKKSRTPQLKRRLFKVRIESSAEKSLEDSETQGSAPITTDGVSTLMKMKSEKSKEKRVVRGVVMHECSESRTRTRVPPPQIDPKDKGKAKMVEPENPLKKKDQIKFDEELAHILSAQLQDELEEEERPAKQREEAANIAE
ncbi:hypothetical protein Tco_1195807 [Tanacetum coccineum]